MSTPKLSFKIPGAGETEGDVTTHDVATAPGKEREREPVYGGDIANISETMDLDTDQAGELYIPLRWAMMARLNT